MLSKNVDILNSIVFSVDLHRVKSEHCKDDDDDDITDDERKGEQMINHPGAMQSGNYHRGKTLYHAPYKYIQKVSN